MSIRQLMKVKPYLLRDYRIDALQIVQERLLEQSNEKDQDLTLEQILHHIELTGKAPFAEPAYGAKWSVLSRKRKSGLLLLWLYYIAEKEKLDMTAVYAHRLLQGLVGNSISRTVVLEAFGSSERTAANKSSDWDRIDHIINKYRGRVTASLLLNKEKIALIKNNVWSELKAD